MKKFFKTMIVFLLAIVIVISSVFFDIPGRDTKVYASSKSKVWNGEADTSWYTGDKSSYNISTAEQLAGLAVLTNGMKDPDQFNGITINLTKDIVLNKTDNFKNWDKEPPKNTWSPIGYAAALSTYPAFGGIFNGNGHKIIGLYIDASGYKFGDANVGLFGNVCGATIANVKIEKAYLKSYDAVGAVAGVAERSVFINNEVSDFKAYFGEAGAGGILGKAVAAPFYPELTIYVTSLALFGIAWNPLLFFENCESNSFKGSILYNCKAGKLSFTHDRGSNSAGNVGGIVAVCDENGVAIVNSLVTGGKVYSASNAGMIAPFEDDGNGRVIRNCYSYNFTLDKKSGLTKFIDAKYAKKISKTKLTSKSFAKKLGDGYKWKKGKSPTLVKYDIAKSDKKEIAKTYRILEDGYYTISDGGYITDGNADSAGYAYITSEENAGKYYFKYYDEGYYTITSAANGKVLELNLENDKLITQNKFDSAKFTQRWVITTDDNQGYYIHSHFRGGFIYFDPDWMFVSGRGLIVHKENSYKWKLEKK